MTTTNYERRKLKESARSRERAVLGRDIAPIPFVINTKRRVSCKNSLKLFCEQYLSKWFTKSFGKNHLILIDALERCIKKDEKLAVALPRGTGKSTICLAAVLWSLLYGHKKFIITLSATSKDANKFINTAAQTLENNDLLYEDFPSAVHPIRLLEGSNVRQRGQLHCGKRTNIKISTDHLRLADIDGSVSSGATLVSKGISGSIRGQSVTIGGKICRPDLIILDDIQKDDLAANSNRVDALEHKVLSTIAGLSESGKQLPMISTCTVICPDDLADRWLDRDKHPEWHGIRGKMLDKLPNNLDLWREYKSIVLSSPDDARTFYREHKEDMSEGAKVSWKEDYDPAFTEDALEAAMRYWALDLNSFMAERQNSPLRPENQGIYVESRIIATKTNSLKKSVPPIDTHKITAAIDVHDDLLYYSICAITKDFTVYILEYGTYPDQNKLYFRKSDGGNNTLQKQYKLDTDSSLRLGLERLLIEVSSQVYISLDDTMHRVDRILIDGGYKPDIVESVIQRSGIPNAYPSKGVSIGAKGKPFAEWQKRSGRSFGWRVLEDKIQGRKFKHILVDTNYWKTRLHTSLALQPESKGSLSLYGPDPSNHRMFSDHLTAETPVLVSANGREVYEWNNKPNCDNHYLDCVVYCLAAGSSLGVLTSDNPKY